MKDPKIDMYQHARPQSPLGATEGGGQMQTKPARVSFDTQLDTNSPPANGLRTGHHRSQTTVGVPRNGSVDASNSASGANSHAAESGSGRRAESTTRNVRPPTLVRAKSDHWMKSGSDTPRSDEEDFQLRHGWHEEYTSSEYLKLLNSVSALYFLVFSQLSVNLDVVAFRISTCISRKKDTTLEVYPETQLEAGPARTGA